MRNLLLAAAMSAVIFAPPAAGATFSGYQMTLVGDATVLANGELQLPAGAAGNGAAWLTSALSTTDSFAVNFSFSLARTNSNPMADGIALVLQNGGPNVIGGAGGNIGYSGLNGVGSVVQSYFNNTAGLNTDGDAYQHPGN